MAISVVKAPVVSDVDRMVGSLEKLTERVATGEFETVFIVAIAPDGTYATREVGKRTDVLRKLGIMESIKADILIASSTDEPSGL